MTETKAVADPFRAGFRERAVATLAGRPLEPLPPNFRVAACCALALVIALLVWVFLSSYTEQLRVPGVLALNPAGLDIRAEFDAEIMALEVVEGERVAPGQALAELVAAGNTARGDAVVVDIARSYEVEVAALRQQRSHEQARISAALEDIELRQAEGSRRSVLLAEELKVARASERAARRQLERSGKLALSGYVAAEVTDRWRLALQERQLEVLTKRRLVADVKSLLARLEAERQELVAGHRAQLARIDADSSRVKRQRLQYITTRVQRVVAPHAAQVTGLRKAPGASLARGQPLLTLKPVGAVVEARLQVTARGAVNVKPGDKLTIRVAAYPYAQYGAFDGHIIEVGETSAGPAGDWQVRTSVFPRAGLPLKSGMIVEAVLPLQERRILQWLLGPLRNRWPLT